MTVDGAQARQSSDPALISSVEQFLYLEAELLDDDRLDEWLELVADDVRYTAPVPERRRRHAEPDPPGSYYFLDGKPGLAMRVRRLATDVAWAEDPPSMTRRFVTNVRVGEPDADGVVGVRSNLLLVRSRDLDQPAETVAAERRDALRPRDRRPPANWVVAERSIHFVGTTLGTRNLALLL